MPRSNVSCCYRQEFHCEICGGFTYRGRREFERHFKEWRHQNSMRALGIPNNKNFFEITKIEDAKQLWAHIQVHRRPVMTHPANVCGTDVWGFCNT